MNTENVKSNIFFLNISDEQFFTNLKKILINHPPKDVLFIVHSFIYFEKKRQVRKFFHLIKNYKKCMHFVDTVQVINNVKNNFKKRKWIIKKFKKTEIFTYSLTDAKLYGWSQINYPVIDIRKKYKKFEYRNNILLQNLRHDDYLRINTTYQWLKSFDKRIPYIYNGPVNISNVAPEYKEKCEYINACCNYHLVNRDAEFIDNCVNCNICMYVGRFGSEYLTNKLFFCVLTNKKIITDVNLVKNEPYYDKRWIKVVKQGKRLSPSIIKWIKDKKIVPNYKNKDIVLVDYYVNKLISML